MTTLTFENKNWDEAINKKSLNDLGTFKVNLYYLLKITTSGNRHCQENGKKNEP